MIQKGRLREAGIEEIGIAAYPEGHARIPPDRMEAALDQKIAAARAAGLQVHIVSQFSFSPEAVVGWLKRLRQCGIALPVKVGMAGPTSLTALLRYAKRCGVNASLRGLASGAGSGLIGNVGPDRDSRRPWRRPTASATSARIIFRSAGSCRPRAMPAMRRHGLRPIAPAHDHEKPVSRCCAPDAGIYFRFGQPTAAVRQP